MNVGPPRGEGGKKKPYTEPAFATSEASQDSVRDPLPHLGTWGRLRRAAVRSLEWLLFEPPSITQIEQLARKLLDYGLMSRRNSEPTVFHIPEMAVRFREPRRNVRLALELLAEQGTVEKTQFKDDWKLISRESASSQGTYNPPQFSGPSPKIPLNPPPGWSELQDRAHRAKDAQEFSAIMDEMNRLLSADEKAVGDRDAPDAPPTNRANKKAASSGHQE